VSSDFQIELRGEAEPQAIIVVAVVRGVVVAISRTAVLRIVVPTATTQHSIRAFGVISCYKCSVFLNKNELAWVIKASNVVIFCLYSFSDSL
jgi:hypothetical protein